MKKLYLCLFLVLFSLMNVKGEFQVGSDIQKSPASTINFVAILAGILLVVFIIILIYLVLKKQKPKKTSKKK